MKAKTEKQIGEIEKLISRPHLPFVYFNRGIVRSYKYEFLDLKPDDGFTDMECHFGLIRSDGEPKPSFHALKHLLALLSDTGNDFRTTPLTFRIEAPDAAGLQYTFLQKSDGSRWLALFRTVTVYDLNERKDIPADPLPVTLSFKRKPASIHVYRPNTGTAPIHSAMREKEITVELGAELILVEIRK